MSEIIQTIEVLDQSSGHWSEINKLCDQSECEKTHPHVKFFSDAKIYKGLEYVITSMDDNFNWRVCACGREANQFVISSWKSEINQYEEPICDQCRQDVPGYIDKYFSYITFSSMHFEPSILEPDLINQLEGIED